MSAPVLTIEPDVPLDDAAGTILDGGINSVVVIDDDCRPTGILILPAVSQQRISAPRGVESLEIVTAGSITPIDPVRAAADGLSPGGTTVGEQITERGRLCRSGRGDRHRRPDGGSRD